MRGFKAAEPKRFEGVFSPGKDIQPVQAGFFTKPFQRHSAVGDYGNVQTGREGFHTFEMIAVMMGQENEFQIIRIEIQKGHSSAEFGHRVAVVDDE